MYVLRSETDQKDLICIPCQKAEHRALGNRQCVPGEELY